MTTTEDRARAAMYAIAGTVHDAPPLQLAPARVVMPAADEVRAGGRGARRLIQRRPAGAARPGGAGRDHRRWSLLAPIAAAVAVVVVAVTLVVIRDMPNGSAVPVNSTTSATGPGGVPRYYVALRHFAGKSQDNNQDGIVVGDSLTGKTLEAFAPPAHTTYQSVTAAADDRTFVVFALTSANGTFDIAPRDGPTITGRWFEVRLAPGTAHPARLTPLPIKPQSWVYPATVHDFYQVASGEVFATALSESGQELAVADIPTVPGASASAIQSWQEVKVFSVATGQLLHDWTTNDPAIAVPTNWTWPNQPATPLTWIDGDQALALATDHEALPSGVTTGTVRRLNVAGPASGDLIADSTAIYSGQLTSNDQYGCYAVNYWPPLISADGKTISCVNEVSPSPARRMISFDTDPLGTPATIKPRFDYQVTPPKLLGGALSVLWTSPSGDTQIGVWNSSESLLVDGPASLHVGVISHGKFTPLRFPSILASSPFVSAILQPGEIAF